MKKPASITTKSKVLIFLLTLTIALACNFVENMVSPPPLEDRSNPPPQPTNTSRPIPTPCSSEDCLDACIERLDEVLETRPFDSIGNSIYEDQNANFNLVIYKVNGDKILDPAILNVPPEYRKYQEDTASHTRIWDFYTAIIPPDLRKMVNEFVIFTDGSNGNVGAWVNQSIKDPNSWQVGFDLLDSDYPLYLADALIHETGHLITLNTSQIPYDEEHYYMYDRRLNVTPGCEQLAVDGGCSLPESYINLFYQRFWENTYPEWWDVKQDAENAESFEEYLQSMETFYDSHAELFLNSYAATNITEDMAESFSFFVLNSKPNDESVSSQKVVFYYEFPELVEYRQQIIKGLCSYIR